MRLGMFLDRFPYQWLRTQLASRLFFASTLLVLTYTASPFYAGAVDINRMTFWQRLPWGILGITVPEGFLFLFFGMWGYWVRLDDSRAWLKRLWFVILVVGLIWGSCLYCLCVYLPQVRRTAEKPI